MSKRVQLEQLSIEDLKTFKNNVQKEIGEIVDFINLINKNDLKFKPINKEKALNPNYWKMQHINHKSGRGNPFIEFKRNAQINDAPSILDYLKHKLDDCQPNDNDQKQLIQLAKGKIEFLRVQGASKIAEVLASDYIEKAEKNISVMFGEQQHQTEIQNVLKRLNVLKKGVDRYTLDAFSKPIKEYTSDDIGVHHSNVLKEYDNTIKEMRRIGQIHQSDTSEIVDNLKNSKELFKSKSIINFDFPTKDSTKKTIRNMATLGLSIGSLITGVAATLCAVATAFAPAAPITVPLAAIFGTTSALLGGTALAATAINSALNYWAFKISPSNNEKLSMAVGFTALGLGVTGATGIVSSIGPVAAVGGKASSQAFTTIKNVYATKTVGTAVTSGLSKQKSIKEQLKNLKMEGAQQAEVQQENLTVENNNSERGPRF